MKLFYFNYLIIQKKYPNNNYYYVKKFERWRDLSKFRMEIMAIFYGIDEWCFLKLTLQVG